MQTELFLTGQQMIDMGWYIGEESPLENFTLTIDSTPERRNIKIHFTDVDGGDYLNDWCFDYESTLDDLDMYNHLPCGIQGNGVWYNDHETKRSTCIQINEISEIVGDMLTVELKLYSSCSELNREVDTFSFTHDPEYDCDEEV
jgi:hypothetical protein